MAWIAAGDPDARIAWRKDNAAMLESKEEEEKKDNEAVKTKAQVCIATCVCAVIQTALEGVASDHVPENALDGARHPSSARDWGAPAAASHTPTVCRNGSSDITRNGQPALMQPRPKTRLKSKQPRRAPKEIRTGRR